MMHDPETGRRRAVHALIFTAVYSRHMFVWLSFTQTLADVIAGCEAAWGFFGGIFKVLIPDNLKPVVDQRRPGQSDVHASGWLDYAQARGFGTDPARVRSPKDKPRVERVVQYVRGNFFARRDVPRPGRCAAPRRALVRAPPRGCGCTAPPRNDRPSTSPPTSSRCCSPAPARPYDVPVFATPKVAPDRHVEVGGRSTRCPAS